MNGCFFVRFFVKIKAMKNRQEKRQESRRRGYGITVYFRKFGSRKIELFISDGHRGVSGASDGKLSGACAGAVYDADAERSLYGTSETWDHEYRCAEFCASFSSCIRGIGM